MPGARMGESMKDKRSWFYGDDPKTLKADKRLRVDSLPSKLMSVKAAGVKVNKIKVLEPFANPLHESAFGLKRAVNAGERGKNAGKKTRA